MDQIKIRGKNKLTTHNAKFLVEIEKKINTRMLSLKKNNSILLSDKLIYTDKVLEIHREAFGFLLENLSTFKNLLFEIKQSYDDSIDVRDRIIMQNNSLMRAMSSDKESKNALHEQIDQYLHKIKDLESEIAFLKRKNCNLENELFSNYQTLSNEKEARYALLIENVKLKKENTKLSNNTNAEKPKDVVVLQLALDQCRKDLKDVVQKYNLAIEEYSETVAKAKYEILELEHFELNEKFQDTMKELNELNEKYRLIQHEQKNYQDEIEDLKEKLHELEESGTPRPQWETCEELIGGGIDRWKKLTGNLSSGQKLEFVLNEIGPSIRVDNCEYFEGLGFDPVIPEYLRYNGHVKNLKLSKKELYVLINDIWEAKLNERDLSLQDFMKKYIENKCEDTVSGVELSYNLYHSCRQMVDDERIKLFWGVLNGSLNQDIYYAFRNEWNMLKTRTMSNLKYDQKTVHIIEFEKLLKVLFPLKSDVDIQNITKIIKKQLKMKTDCYDIDVHKLFTESEEGFDHSDLAKELYRQRQMSQEKYIREIVVQLGGKKNLHKLISVDMLKRAFAIIDPHIDHVVMESNVRWVFSDKTSNLNMIYPIALKTLATKLSTGNIQRVGPKHRGKSAKSS